MKQDTWEKKLACAIRCSRCESGLPPNAQRILSVYDHAPICLSCKQEEERRPDYETVSKQMVGTLMADTEVLYSDPGGYCYHHFYPYTCEQD